MSNWFVGIKRQLHAHRFICLALVVFVLAVGSAYTVAAKTGFTFSPTQKLDTEFLACMDTTNILQAVGCVHTHVNGWITTYGISATVSELDKYQARFGADFTCHLAGHEIGQAVLHASGGDVAKSFAECTNSCFSACLHGVVIGYTASNTVQDLLALHPEQDCAAPDIKGGYKLCIHGLGHAFMIGEQYNIPAALGDCDSLAISQLTKDQCYSGVYMELAFAADGLGHGQVASSTYSKPGDLFYPCDTAPTVGNQNYATQCILQWVSQFDAYAYEHRESVFSICASAPNGWGATCAEGVGLIQASRSTSPSPLKTLCEGAPTEDWRDRCLLGAYAYFLNANSPQAATALCSSLTAEEQKVCDPNYDQSDFESVPVPMSGTGL